MPTTLTVTGIYLCMNNSSNSGKAKPIKWKRKALVNPEPPLPGFDDLFDDITNLTNEKISLCERMNDYVQRILSKHLLKHGWIENEFQNYRLGFLNSVHRPLLKYDVVGLDGNGELIVESRRTILVHRLTWEHLDANTARDCFLEFEQAFLIAHNNPDGENNL